MGTAEINELVKISPYFLSHENVWISYDKEADVMYINFKKPSHADDSELTDDDIIIRYEKGDIVGITILNAKNRA